MTSHIFDVAVIGAGMFGSSIAKYISGFGFDTAIIGPAEPNRGEQADQYAFGAYYDEARITRRLGWDEVWGTLDARSLERFNTIESDSGIRFFHECGSLVVMANSIVHRTNAILKQCEIEDIDVDRLSAESLAREFSSLRLPPMSGGVEGLLERQAAGYINPRQLVQAQLTLAQRSGTKLVRASVTAVERVNDTQPWTLWLGESDRHVRARRIVVAAGAFVNHNNVLPQGIRLVLRAFTEPNLLFEVSDNQLPDLRALPAVVTVDPEDTGDENTSIYMVPPVRYPDGKWYMRIGPGMQPLVEELGDVKDMVAWHTNQRITVAQRIFLTRMMKMMVPDLEPVSTVEACCIIEKTPSRYPYLGRLNDEDDSCVIAVGGNGHGARGCDEIGRIVANMTIGKPWDSSIPQEIFKPLVSTGPTDKTCERPGFLKPPFGLC